MAIRVRGDIMIGALPASNKGPVTKMAIAMATAAAKKSNNRFGLIILRPNFSAP
ncbi:MAG TPA: hypothetical protein VGO59_04595 [Verrucomicrobiae bacterium]|jgi:hypothetical protein